MSFRPGLADPATEKGRPQEMEEQTLQSRARAIVVDAFSVTKYDGPFESLVAPTKSFGIRGTSTAEVFALRLAVGAAKAVDQLAAELDRRAS
jgi:hypothetical protein